MHALYLTVSSFVGAAQVGDAIILFRARGVCSKTLALFSFVEYIWAGFSLMAFRSVESSWLPLSFVAYIAFGFVLAFTLRPRTTSVKDATSVTVPLWFVFLGGCFGAYFCAASIYVNAQA
jgi:hypothetical protein